jgi:ribosomal protein S18 acetylase RimI-like enzyme
MLEIKTTEDAASIAAARQLFRDYGEFLRERVACGSHFHFARFLEEVDRLPEDYAGRNGEVLVGFVGGEAAACIAYRASAQAGGESAEIKRLFVRPRFRGQGHARGMVEEALQRLKARGFGRVILDTDVDHMAGALKLYRSLGFREYGERVGPLALLERYLP